MTTTDWIIFAGWVLLFLGFVCPVGIDISRDYQARKQDQMKGHQ
ncbi:hypothetical protein [Comamonas antarctica]|nr:hypothetical protein [Comamonas antarctica]